uniref:IRG-type G domain-containing protein n=1 Tax=Pygocentrus nattereri TaxID=42514 RepID=A0A3B4CBF5_PYGNA
MISSSLPSPSFGISEAEMNEMSSVLQSYKATDVLAQVEGMLEQMTSVTLNIAVTGESGAGKSSFINAFRGVDDEGPEAAETGVTATTQVALAYPHPMAHNVLLWDLPGIGTTSFQPGTYLEDVGLLKYDFFIIVTADRFQEYHYALAKCIMQAQKKFYFIRNKVDRDLEANAMRRSQKGLSDADVLDHLRANCEKNLTMCQGGKPRVFLLSCFDPQRYDFPVLQMTLLEELQGHKQHALLLSLPNLSATLIQNKKKALAGAVWKRAMVACLSSVGVGNSLCSIIPKVMDTLKSYQQAFCLDADSLHRLASITGISFEVQNVNKSYSNALESTLSQAVPVQQVLAKQLERRVPVLGTVIAGGVSFVACYFLLTSALKNLSEDGERVMQRILLVAVSKQKYCLDDCECNQSCFGIQGSHLSTMFTHV